MKNQNKMLTRSILPHILFSFVIVTIFLTVFTRLAHSSDVTLMWNPVAEADGYKVYYRLENGSYQDPIDVGDQTTYTFAELDPGTYYFAVTAYNSYGESGYSDEVSFIVEPPSAVTYSISATANGNGGITPAGTITVNQGSNQTFNITPSSGYHIDDVLVDGASVGAVSSYTFSNVTANHNISAGFAIDAVAIHSITATANGSGSITPAGTTTVNHGSNQGFTIVPSNGYRIVDVRVDGASVGAVSSYTFSNVTANHNISASFGLDNQAPSANAGPDQTVSEGAIVTLNGLNSTDPGGSITSYSWVQTEGPTVALPNSEVAEVTFTAPDVEPNGAAFVFRLTVTDNGGLESSDTCIINVSSVNVQPVAEAGPNQKANEEETVTLDGSRSNYPDNDIITYLWEQKTGPNVNLSDPTASQPTFTAPDVGDDGVSLSFQLTVEDNGGLKATDNCIVNVLWANIPPVADAGPDLSGAEGSTVTLDGSKSDDPDDNIISYQWAQISGNPVTLSDPTAVSPTFTVSRGTQGDVPYVFQLTVADNGGLEDADTCTVRIELSTGSPPIPDIKANGQDGPITISEGQPLSVTVCLDPGEDYVGQRLDWWMTCRSPDNVWTSYIWWQNIWMDGIERAGGTTSGLITYGSTIDGTI